MKTETPSKAAKSKAAKSKAAKSKAAKSKEGVALWRKPTRPSGVQ